jgi:hypothetical protein
MKSTNQNDFRNSFKNKTQGNPDSEQSIFLAGMSTEHSVYNVLIPHKQHGDLIKSSSKNLHIYKNLKSIFYHVGHKSDVLGNTPYKTPSIIRIDTIRPLDAGYELIHSGFHPLIMCPVEGETPTGCYKKGKLDDESELMIRTSVIYPLRSMKYRNITKKFTKTQYNRNITRQCMSVFIPNVLLFRKRLQTNLKDDQNDQFPFMLWNECRYINLCMVSSASTCEGLDQESIKSIIRGKLTCVFDTALKQREGKEGSFDTLVLSDLLCRTPELRQYYCEAVKELLQTYSFHFRLISFALHDQELLHSLQSILLNTYPHNKFNYTESSEIHSRTSDMDTTCD